MKFSPVKSILFEALFNSSQMHVSAIRVAFSGACKTQIACLGASEFYSHQIPLTVLSL